MNKKIHNLRGFSANAGNQNPRWRTVFIALVLALAVGSAGQTPSVIAAPAGVPVKVYMELVNPKTRVCVGKTAQYPVRVYTPPTTSAGIDFDRYALPGIKVEGFSQDKTVGDFLGAKKGTLTTRTTAPSDEDIDEAGGFESTPNTAYFTFKAKKAGTTTLYFEASAHGQYVSDKVSVKVVNCKYKVIIGSQMNWCGPYGCIKFRGVSTDGQVTADETGYIFTGTAPVYWVSTSKVPNCGAVNSLGIGQVKMRGNLSDSGQLLLELNYDTVPFTDVVTCPGIGSGSSALPITPSPLTVTVPSFGGVVQLSQQMDGGPEPALGSANVYVIPLESAR